jgi:hypothetical protein
LHTNSALLDVTAFAGASSLTERFTARVLSGEDDTNAQPKYEAFLVEGDILAQWCGRNSTNVSDVLFLPH